MASDGRSERAAARSGAWGWVGRLTILVPSLRRLRGGEEEAGGRREERGWRRRNREEAGGEEEEEEQGREGGGSFQI